MPLVTQRVRTIPMETDTWRHGGYAVHLTMVGTPFVPSILPLSLKYCHA